MRWHFWHSTYKLSTKAYLTLSDKAAMTNRVAFFCVQNFSAFQGSLRELWLVGVSFLIMFPCWYLCGTSFSGWTRQEDDWRVEAEERTRAKKTGTACFAKRAISCQGRALNSFSYTLEDCLEVRVSVCDVEGEHSFLWVFAANHLCVAKLYVLFLVFKNIRALMDEVWVLMMLLE